MAHYAMTHVWNEMEHVWNELEHVPEWIEPDVLERAFDEFDPREGKLFWNNRPTKAFLYLEAANHPCGAKLPKANYGDARMLLRHLEDLGWVEIKRTGPRGGRRWHITTIGKEKLEAADEWRLKLKAKDS